MPNKNTYQKEISIEFKGKTYSAYYKIVGRTGHESVEVSNPLWGTPRSASLFGSNPEILAKRLLREMVRGYLKNN